MSAIWACLQCTLTSSGLACACLRTSPPWSSTAQLIVWVTSAWKKNFNYSSSVPFPKNSRKAYQEAPASTTSIGQGSKIYVAFLNLFAAFSTTSDKQQVLQMVADFSHNTLSWRSVILWNFSVFLTTTLWPQLTIVTSVIVWSCGQTPRKSTFSSTCLARRGKHGCSRACCGWGQSRSLWWQLRASICQKMVW